MKIKRFFAEDIRQAMRMVKEELGADAVIMSNKSVDGAKLKKLICLILKRKRIVYMY
jgi:flagellar biosynthesis GTPase FlhF